MNTMEEPLSERRMIENEVVTREFNEKIKKGFDELKKIAKEDGQRGLVGSDNTPLMYYCECSFIDCRQRIEMKPSKYNQIHKKRDNFIVVPGHETNKIESVVQAESDYNVVEKSLVPQEVS
jgi:hypothetical protein